MKRVVRVLLVVLVALALIPLPAFAGHHHGGGHHGGPRVGVWIGPGFWWGPRWIAPRLAYGYPYAYPYPYPAYRERVVVVEEPTVYVERSAPQESSSSSWWYYCESARAYYPEVTRCREPWVKVAPRPE